MTDDTRLATLVADVRAGLGSRPLSVPSTYFYDGRGSDLFDQITRLEEYYPTRAEAEILDAHAADVVAATRARTLVELGSGTSEKTRLLLSAFEKEGALGVFAPLDVDPVVLGQAAEQLAVEHPGMRVEPVVGDFLGGLEGLPTDGPVLLVFLGSTLGNLDPDQRAVFLATVRERIGPDGWLLLGTDLVKDVGRLERAYDDAAGVTAEFNRNLLRVLDDELGADFDPETFEHVAVWVAEHERIEMRLRSRVAQRVRLPAADLVLDLEAGEEIRTEISSKFRREGVEAELAAAGLVVEHWWTDAADDFALSLSRPR